MGTSNFYQKLKRIALHSWMNASDTKRAIPKAAQQRIQQQVRASELQHSGQIRICVEAALPLGYIWRGLASRARAITLFGKLRVWDTERNNGVLIYVLLAERKIEVIADRGLSQHVDEKVWQAAIHQMQIAFKAQQFEAGLSFAIEQVSAQLMTYFPNSSIHSPDINELADAPVIQ
jgi:uncharacterized membrane protein